MKEIEDIINEMEDWLMDDHDPDYEIEDDCNGDLFGVLLWALAGGVIGFMVAWGIWG